MSIIETVEPRLVTVPAKPSVVLLLPGRSSRIGAAFAFSSLFNLYLYADISGGSVNQWASLLSGSSQYITYANYGPLVTYPIYAAADAIINQLTVWERYIINTNPR